MQRAIVKAVPSADSLLLRARQPDAAGGPPPERLISLSNLTGPRFGSQRTGTPDEPFAFEARDALRRLVIGKDVLFHIEHSTSTGRQYGHVWIPPSQASPAPPPGLSVAEAMVKAGWCRVRDSARDSRASEEDPALQSLLLLEHQAQQDARGIWTSPEAPKVNRSFHYSSPDDPRSFLQTYKGKELQGIIEQVKDAATLRIQLLLPSPSSPSSITHQYITMALSGLKVPAIDAGPDGSGPEPLAEEARYFVESRLLHRGVHIRLEGTTGGYILLGTVIHPAGSIVEAILSQGLGRIVEWSVALSHDGPDRLYAAQGRAQERGLGLWRREGGGLPSSSSSPSSKPPSSKEAIVTKVYSGDSVDLLPISSDGKENGTERRVFLSSIRSPRVKDPLEAPFVEEAKEFLRKRLIGQKVQVRTDYHKDDREFVSLTTKKGQDAGGLMVGRGLARVIRHRRDDEDRSPLYESLLEKETMAQEQVQGLHKFQGDKAPSSSSSSLPEVPAPLRDISESVTKAKAMLSTLQRGSKSLDAVVEYVVHAGRYRLRIPKESCKLTLVLSGIRVPRSSGSKAGPPEPFGDDASTWATRHLLQRDVTLTVEGVDRTGAFIGTLSLPKKKDHLPGAVTDSEDWEEAGVAGSLVALGLAYIHSYAKDTSAFGSALEKADQSARKRRLGVWSLEEPEPEKDTIQPQPSSHDASPTIPQYLDLVITDIADQGRLTILLLGSSSAQLNALMQDLSLSIPSAPSLSLDQIKVGQVLAAQFSQDHVWYRARVKAKLRTADTVEVQYIDYGNSEELSIHHLKALPDSCDLSHLPPQAHEATLAYLRLPSHAEPYGEEAQERLKELLGGKQLVGRVEQVEGGRSTSSGTKGRKGGSSKSSSSSGLYHLTLYDPQHASSPDASLNAQLIREGFARVAPKCRYRRGLGPSTEAEEDAWVLKLEQEEESSRQSRQGMWEYGDIRGDDEDAF
ncbi:MAG: hypothetical protein DHS80DRAFT_32268 [Piptocephalis tieghemiana]|nr:MAG: hypothetical protein DHS80DRAFT_32268 [Piptocephalis tieghemiana]